tara:strand:- start:152 stop:346 length:195 start_codon:yes stop_codon:yes gene_type:complete
MKNYLTPLAILLGSIIISISVYLAITSEERATFNYCVETNSKKYKTAPLEETKKLCRALQYLQN